MKLFQLHYFCTACAYRNITRAAEALHVSQPAVTMAIQSLESEFGLRLLDRGERGFVLTPDGEFFLREARGVLSRTDSLSSAMEERKRLGAASLRFGATPMAGAGFTQELFRALRAGSPPLAVNLVEGGRPRLLQLLDEDLIDFAFVAVHGLPPDVYDCIPLRDSEVVFCAHPSSPLARLKTIDSAAQIGGEPLAFFSDEFYLSGLLRDFFGREGLTPNIICRASQIFTVIQFVRRGTAAAFLNLDAAAEFSDIVPIPLREPITLRLGFVWKKGPRAAELEPAVRRLADELAGGKH